MKNEISNWIWTDEWSEQQKESPTFVLFRKNIFLDSEPVDAKLHISADSKYKLYMNARFVEFGPAKGDHQVWYKDTIDIKKHLCKGINTIAIIVLRYPNGSYRGNQSIIPSILPGLYIKGKVTNEKGECITISGDRTWKCKIDDTRKIIPESKGFAPLHIYEEMRADAALTSWLETSYHDESWENAVPYLKEEIRKAVSPANLENRKIPFMRRQQRRFKEIMQSEGLWDPSLLDEFIAGAGKIVVPPNSEVSFELHAGEEMTGYYTLLMQQGADAKITILQSESYVQNQLSKDHMPLKEDRLDYMNGHLEGYQDEYYPIGNGNETSTEIYTPFWFRTFRFVKITIVTKETELILADIFFEETGYPLDIKTYVTTSDPSLDRIWDISQRTLRRCMHETYEDCPYYEQLQYSMDSRAQILFTYNIAADDRLARQCMDDFRRSQRYDGLLYSAYPNMKPNVIPTFSIFYILMLHDHMLYFGDKELIRDHMPAVEQILRFFQKHIGDNGLVMKIGDRHGEGRFWSFIDWVPEWEGGGVPNAIVNGSITIESLYYILGLMRASDLAEYIGSMEQKKYFLQLADDLRQSVRKNSIGENQMIQDGPDVEEYSQHCQVIGVLTDTLNKEEGKNALLRTLTYKEKYAQCTVSNLLYLYAALAKVDLYEKTDECWNVWRKMLAKHMTTCAEAEEYARSDCHAWGALALYEMPAVILGVKPVEPGYAAVSINPHTGYLSHAKGIVSTPKGMISVEWEKNNEEIEINYSIPAGMKLISKQ